MKEGRLCWRPLSLRQFAVDRFVKFVLIGTERHLLKAMEQSAWPSV
jgi:hypothetical protein